jgi:hypothetical protein
MYCIGLNYMNQGLNLKIMFYFRSFLTVEPASSPIKNELFLTHFNQFTHNFLSCTFQNSDPNGILSHGISNHCLQVLQLSY